MKKTFKVISLIILTIGLLSSFVFANAASTRSSLYLNDYSASISAKRNGTISISASIFGKGYLDRIGVSSITVYESRDGKSYTKYGTFSSDDYPSMMGSGSSYDDTVYEFTGTVGYSYKATVYCYGESGSGSDTKPYYTTSVTARW